MLYLLGVLQEAISFCPQLCPLRIENVGTERASRFGRFLGGVLALYVLTVLQER